MADASYVFDGEPQGGSERFTALEELYDGATKRHIEAIGTGPGATCLEVGAGGGSIARWLARRAGRGRVVATDRDPSFLKRVASDGIEVRRHDINVDPLPENTFDLVHARLVVMHLTDPAAAIARMGLALKPGGWLIVEEFDATRSADGPGTVSKSSVAFRAVLERSGVDLLCGARLPSLFRNAGLCEIGGETRAVLWRGRSAGARLMHANYTSVRDAILATGIVNVQEFTNDVERLSDPEFLSTTPTMWSVWGRRTEAEIDRPIAGS